MRTDRRGRLSLSLVETLESRQFLSVSPAVALPAMTPNLVIVTPPTAGGITLHEQAGAQFTASLGTFITPAPARNLHAVINWGDGTTSKGTIVPAVVVGIDELKFEVDGTHTYKRPGTFGIKVTVTQPGPTSTSPIRLVATLRDRAIVAGSTVLLDGTISGKYSPAPVAADIGATYVFNGTGTAGALGSVLAHGLVTLPGFIATGQATGTLTLTESGPSATAVNNSVTLKLTGPTEPGFGPFPSTLSYTISSGTGAFAGATGSGSIAVTLNSDLTFTFVITSAAPPPVV